MKTVGAPGRHRAPTVYRPQRTFLKAMIMLALCSGITAAAADEAQTNTDITWMWVFITFTILDVVLYLYIAWLWWRQPND